MLSFADNLCKQFGPRSGPTGGRIQTDSVLGKKKLKTFLKKIMKNYTAYKEFKYHPKTSTLPLSHCAPFFQGPLQPMMPLLQGT